MTEFDNLFENEFFYIDSNNLNEIIEKMYGYAIVNNEIILDSIEDASQLEGSGAYVYIQIDENEINIYQDFNGSYGLYIYQKDNFFAISNSFLKLVETLKEKTDISLSLNKNYADSFLFADLCTYSYGETLINEINVIPRNFIININKNNKNVSFDEIDYEEQTILINSKEGFEILDKWYDKWVKIIRSIKSKTNNLSIDLSGGFDSRVVATLWLTANIDLEKVRIKTHQDNKDVHAEDYQIASKIAKEFNFKLNHSSFSYDINKFKEIETPLNISFYSKLGFHKQMYFKLSKSSEKVFTITGEGGECIRGYPNQTPKEYINHIKNICNKYDPSLTNPTIKIIEKSFQNIMNKFNLDKNSKKITEIHYREVRTRNHYGKASVESMFSNWITLTPLIDKDLRKLDLNTDDCSDRSLLITLIYTRYCPKLLNFEFEGNRSIKQSTIDFANELNKKYPLNKGEYDYISGPSVNKTRHIQKNKGISNIDIENYLKNVFLTKSFQMDFKKYFSSDNYNLILELFEKQNFHPLKNIYSSLAIILIKNFIEYNKTKRLMKSYEWINNYLSKINEKNINENKNFNDTILKKYATARIDIKNEGEKNNSIELVDFSDSNSKITFPDWFNKDDCQGMVLTNDKGSLDFTIKCINDGNLKIWLRSLDTKTKSGKRIPIFIDYDSFKVNGKTIFNKNRLITHDKPFIFNKKVKNNEIININIIWKPFDENSDYYPF